MTLEEWKQAARQLHACVAHLFKPKENQVILDFISTVGAKDAEKVFAASKPAE